MSVKKMRWWSLLKVVKISKMEEQIESEYEYKIGERGLKLITQDKRERLKSSGASSSTPKSKSKSKSKPIRRRRRPLISSSKMMSTLNCLLFVALTLAQATFRAALNPPSNDELVIASQLFIWCDVLSMVSSLLAAACVIRAKLGDRELADDAQEFSAAFIAIAAVMMTAAFTLVIYIRFPGETIIIVVGIGMLFTGIVSPVVCELLVRPRWTRLPSFLLGRA